MAPSDAADNERLRTIAEAAKHLGVSRDTVYRLARDGELEMLKIGRGSTRVTKHSIDKYIKNAKRIVPTRK